MAMSPTCASHTMRATSGDLHRDTSAPLGMLDPHTGALVVVARLPVNQPTRPARPVLHGDHFPAHRARCTWA